MPRHARNRFYFGPKTFTASQRRAFQYQTTAATRALAGLAAHVWQRYWRFEGVPEYRRGSLVGVMYPRANFLLVVNVHLRREELEVVHNGMSVVSEMRGMAQCTLISGFPASFQAIQDDDLHALRKFAAYEDVSIDEPASMNVIPAAARSSLSPLEYALMLGNLECARHLLDRFGTRGVPVDKLIRSALCCDLGNVLGCLDLLFSLPDVEETLSDAAVLAAFRAYHEREIFERVLKLAGWTTSTPPRHEVLQNALMESRTAYGTRMLMDLGANVAGYTHTPHGYFMQQSRRPLFLDWLNQHPSCVEAARVMLEGGAKPAIGHDMRSWRGKVLLTQSPIFTCCTAKKNLEMFKLLLEFIDDFDMEGYRCMMDCLSHPDWLAAMIEAGAPVNYEDGITPTPLEKVLQDKRSKSAKILIEAGADLEVRFVKRNSMKIAAENGWSDVLKLLLDRNLASSDRGSRSRREAALVQACQKGHFECVELLIEAGVASTATGGSTLLHMASASGFLEIVELLLENGAKVDAIDSGGRTPLIAAAAAHVIGIDYTPSAPVPKKKRRVKQKPLSAKRRAEFAAECQMSVGERRRLRARQRTAERRQRREEVFEGEDDGEEEQVREDPIAGDDKLAILQALLDAGADPEHVDDDDMTAYDHAREALDEESCELLEMAQE